MVFQGVFTIILMVCAYIKRVTELQKNVL
jgi:hypothetical protein